MTEPLTPDSVTPAPSSASSASSKAATDENFGRRLREAWHKTVGTWATDEKGTASLVTRLVGFGSLSTDEAKRVLADAKKRVEENKAELDRRVDESLIKAAAVFGSDTPRDKEEVKRLEERIAELESRLRALET